MSSRRHAPLFAGLLVALVAAVALTIAHHAPRPPVAPRLAIDAALHDPHTRSTLAGSHWTSAVTAALDSRTERVSFFAGPQLVAEVAVQSGGQVLAGVDDRALPVPYGDWIAYQPALLIALSALFVLVAGVAPWRRVRNLDVAASLSLVVAVVLFQHRYVDPSTVTAALALIYLMARCVLRALGPERPKPPQAPLMAVITPGLEPCQRIRWLRGLLLVVGLLFVMVGLSSPDAVDVIYAVMQGATRIVHGILPYGHLPPGVIHGDTYPILSYALYVPLALLAPVNTVWDSVDAGLGVAVLAALVAAWAMFRTTAGRRGGRDTPRSLEAEEAGLRAALAWLALPPVLITASTGTTDVVLAAMLAVAVLLWRRPTWCAALLAVAGWFKLAPFALLPVALAPLRGRRLVAPVAAVAAVSVASLGLVLVLGGMSGFPAMIHAVSYQFSRGSFQSVWSALGVSGLQPVGQAAVLGLIAASVVKLRREPGLALDRSRMAALAAAILIALQLAADYWAFLYLTWVVPLVGVSLLSDELPAKEAIAEPTVAHSPEPAGAIAA